MPASPRMSMTRPRPVSRHCASAASSCRSSRRRPTNAWRPDRAGSRKRAQSPRLDRLGEPLDGQLADLGAVDPLGERPVDCIRDEDLAGRGLIRQA